MFYMMLFHMIPFESSWNVATTKMPAWVGNPEDKIVCNNYDFVCTQTPWDSCNIGLPTHLNSDLATCRFVHNKHFWSCVKCEILHWAQQYCCCAMYKISNSGQLSNMSWANEVSQDLSIIWISGGDLLQQHPDWTETCIKDNPSG